MTKSNKIEKYIVAGLADVLSCFSISTSMAVQTYSDILEKRIQEAIEILLSEIRQGNFSNIDDNDAVSIVARFQRDAMEGVAKNNLRLMAKVINGMAEKEELKAPVFLKYANILSTLTYDEIKVLGIMAQEATGEINTVFDGFQKRNPIYEKDPGAYKLKKVVPEFRSIQQALLRTGLITMDLKTKIEQTKKIKAKKLMYSSSNIEPDFDVTATPSYIFSLTPLMCKILEYANILGYKL